MYPNSEVVSLLRPKVFPLDADLSLSKSLFLGYWSGEALTILFLVKSYLDPYPMKLALLFFTSGSG